jgi:hypothetical protein
MKTTDSKHIDDKRDKQSKGEKQRECTSDQMNRRQFRAFFKMHQIQ